MTVRELYDGMCTYIPENLRCEWDNDGIMVCPDSEAEVKNVLIALDVTEEIVDYAIIMGYDEYYEGSLMSGPVASINYVKNGIEALYVSSKKSISKPTYISI